MTREEAINEIKSWDFLNEKESEAVQTLIPELRESEDERIRQQLLWLCDEWEHNPERRTVPADIGNIKQIRKYLEEQKESLHVQEICKENADSFTSEDEKIRKEIIDFLETIPASELKRIPRPINEWFAWLEKQKESHIPWYDYQKSKEAGYTIVPNEEYDRLTKPAEWSEEDKRMTDNIVSVLGQFIDYKSVSGIGSGYATPRYTKEIDWLKSISPQPSWKPSDEQMEGLKFFLEFHRSQRNAGTVNWREYDAIESLYEQLKKL